MAGGTMNAWVQGFERLFAAGSATGLGEGELLDRFVSRRDDAAFESIVNRHGPMVRGVCRRLLRDPNDVDDAFQATFLVLARKAGTLRRRELLGNWLYGVAYRVSLRSRANAARRRANETTAEGVEGFAVARSQPYADEDVPTLHEEVHRLPEKYRVPVVLCFLEGLTHEEAADRLQWPVGTVKGRLARAKDLLRNRLTRRGLTLASGAAVAEALALDASAALPSTLVASTVRAAALAAAGTSAVAAGLVSVEAAALSEGVTHAMSLSTIKLFASILVAATVTTGASALAYQQVAGPPREPNGPRATETKSVSAQTPKSVTTTVDNAGPASLKTKANAADLANFNEELLSQSEWSANTVQSLIVTSNRMRAEQIQAAGDEAELGRTAASLGIEPTAANLKGVKILGAHRGHLERMTKLESVATTLWSRVQDHNQNDYRAIATKAKEDASGVVLNAFAMLTGRPMSVPGAVAAARGDTAGPAAKGDGTPVVTTSTSSTVGMEGGGLGFDPDEAKIEDDQYRVGIAELGPKLMAADKSPKTKAIIAKLEEPITMAFAHETPFSDVLRYIKSATQGPSGTGIAVYVDPAGLDEVEKTMASTVTLDLEGVPLKTTLRLLLKQLGLAYCVRDGVLMISSPGGIFQELRESMQGTSPQVLEDLDMRVLSPLLRRPGGKGMGGMQGMGGARGGMM